MHTVCPAAVNPVAVSRRNGGPAVVCGVLERENDREAVSGHVDPIVADPGTLAVFCCGHGIPGGPMRAHGGFRTPGEVTTYTDCPIWRSELERLQRGPQARLVAEGPVTRVPR